MPVGIMQVVNNTDLKVTYHNFESGYHVEVNPKVAPWGGGEEVLPSSKVKDDTVPWFDAHNPKKHIQIQVGKAQYKLSERDGHFHLRYWDHDLELVRNLGELTNGGQYILRFDLDRSPDARKELVITIHDYPYGDRNYKGVVTANLLQHLTAIVAGVTAKLIS
ncbi:hypothetical protein ETB97_009053 [Aspergillus alliaceus]|uniref:Uncharacterized protein n=1 Tax=Petromyces alliaceus TaxID=209559 RepID=A0A5N7C7N4_PETAA|nr:hypothetical protein BDV23DRAFT_155967 [Aspergillus alliaceus]KAF5863946.1 hypothetical protein ETB97_009053 [Aspergillus burnettii]